MDKNKRLLENELAILELERKAAETEALSDRKETASAEYLSEGSCQVRSSENRLGPRTLGDALSANARKPPICWSITPGFMRNSSKIYCRSAEIEEESRAAHGAFQEYLWLQGGVCRRTGTQHVLNRFGDLLRKLPGAEAIYEDASAFLGREIAEIIFGSEYEMPVFPSGERS